METIERKEIGSRINELMYLTGLNQSKFAQKIGTTHQTVRNISKGLNKPRYEFVELVISAFPTLNKDWLMEGKGLPFSETDLQTNSISTKNKLP